MTSSEFERLVRKAERTAADSPTAYRLRVMLLGGLGYAYVWLLLLAALAALAVLAMAIVGTDAVRVPVSVGRELGIPLVLFAGAVGKALWVRLDAPAGMPLARHDFPELFGALDDIRNALRGPRLHVVLLNDQFNASITQIPRLGVLGWHRNHLVLGLPLLLALTREQLLAVLAHEYGHLSGSHGKIGTWIYRIRRTWHQLMMTFAERRGVAAVLIKRFVGWYAPYFNAYSFALARSEEYEADRAAAALAGSTDTGGALVRIATAARYLDRDYWPGVFAQADQSPTPSQAPYRHFAHSTDFGLPSERAVSLLDEALSAETDLGDTHPSLSDRLTALGVAPRIPEATDESAARSFLGPHLDRIVADFDQGWRASCAPWWAERHARVQGARARLVELASKPQSDLTVDELLERARHVDDLDGRDAALPIYRQVLERDPRVPVARAIVGLAMLRDGDEEGIDMIEGAMAADADLTIAGNQALRNHFAAQGDLERANAYHRRAAEHAEKLERIQAERSTIPFQAVYDPPDLEAGALDELVARLRADSFIRHAYLVRKRLELSDEPVYVLGVTGSFRFTLKDDRAAVAGRIASALDLPIDLYVVVLAGDNRKRLLPILKKVKGAKLF